MSPVRRVQRSVSRNLTRSLTAVGVVGGLAGLTLSGPVGAAAAATGDGTPQVVNQESVEVLLDSAGKVEEQRLYSQLTVLGDGTVTVQDPTSGKGLRDLNGFSTPLVRDGKAQYSIDVDGREDRRTVADFDGELPVTFKASYVLDGQRVDPEDVVGESGTLETTYTVVNRTAEPTEVTYKNGKGEDVTETVDVVTPYVGRLALELPEQFKDVRAEGADDGGDGRGGTGLSWTLVLFEPIGEPAQQLTWTAEVTDAELPPATLQVVPVDPDGNRVIDNGQLSFGEGAAGAAALTKGAYKIDGKILEVRDGARKIFDGLVKLAEGANALNAGLADTAAPGAQQLADGLGQAEAGGVKLATGLGQLDAGADQLSAGLSTLNEKAAALGPGSAALAKGSADLTAGLTLIKQGIDALPTTIQTNPGFMALKEALAGVQAGIGTPTTAPLDSDSDGTYDVTLLNGIAQLKLGLSNPGWDTDGNGKVKFLGPNDPGNERPGVKEVAGLLSAQLDRPATGPADPGGAKQVVQLVGTLLGCFSGGSWQAGCAALAANPTQSATVAALLKGLYDNIGTSTTPDTALFALNGIVLGVGGFVPHTSPPDPTATTLINGLQKIQWGLSNPNCDLSDPKNAANPCGVREVQGLVSGGLDLLVQGISATLSEAVGAALVGSQKIADGQATVAGSAPALIGGIGQLDAGGKKLADGTGAAALGSGDLVTGLGKLSDGSDKLAAGLGAAADGSGQIADGVGQVKDGVDTLQEGANRLSGEGSSLLAGSANDAATSTARKAALLTAMAAKAEDGAMPYGLPEGATGDAAFSYVLAGANTDAADNTVRGGAALALLALGSLSAFVLRRRFTA